jgi:hypothetical protein
MASAFAGAKGGVPVVIEPGEIIAFSGAHSHVGAPNPLIPYAGGTGQASRQKHCR